MPNSRFMARHGAALFGALAGLIILATSAETAIGDKPSTPVTVTNPETSPVPTTVTNPSTTPALTSSVDDPGRVAYQSITDQVCAPPPNPNQCVVDFPAVPQGHRLVIQHVSGSVSIFTSATSAQAVILSDGKLVSSFFVPVDVGHISSFDQPVLVYGDGGVTPEIQVTSLVSNSFISKANFALTGYLLDCTTAIPCAPIAH